MRSIQVATRVLNAYDGDEYNEAELRDASEPTDDALDEDIIELILHNTQIFNRLRLNILDAA